MIARELEALPLGTPFAPLTGMAEPIRYRPRTEQRRTARLYIKLSPDDLAWIRARAAEAGVSMGHYVLSQILPRPPCAEPETPEHD